MPLSSFLHFQLSLLTSNSLLCLVGILIEASRNTGKCCLVPLFLYTPLDVLPVLCIVDDEVSKFSLRMHEALVPEGAIGIKDFLLKALVEPI